MRYVLTPAHSTQRDVRRVARECLDDAIERLDAVLSPDDIETSVHEVRKRCKETRGLARLVRPSLGDGFRAFDRTVRSAANELSAMRDAHVLLDTFDLLLAARPDDEWLRSLRDHQARLAIAPRIEVPFARARELLAEARPLSQHWKIAEGFEPIEDGLEVTYRLGRDRLHRAIELPSDPRVHDWRTAVKHLWYQLRLLQDASPSVLGPVVEQLDDLADALGDDHDLAVLVELLDEDPERFGPLAAVDHARTLARSAQASLRERAFRSGAVIYAEAADDFSRRVAAYWRLSVSDGIEQPLGGIVAAPDSESDADETDDASVPIERERRFLVEQLPADLATADCVELRQGYLAVGERASVRVRDAAQEGCTLTVKVGSSSAERLELEWPIDRAVFEATWPSTEGQRIDKVRHRMTAGDHIVELDVFADALDGLVIAEVEFPTREALVGFTPPPWFGREVTDDARYTNAALAVDGLPSPQTPA